MANKDFQIQDLLAPFRGQLAILPFLASEAQMEASDMILVAILQVHTERVIGCA